MPAHPLCAVLVAVALLTACGSDDGAGTATSTTGGSTSTSSAPADPTTTTSSAHEVRVVVTGEEVQGGAQKVGLDLGEAVVLHVESDTEDEVHVHGYDLTAAVAPGAPASISFTADIPGQFEVELEGAGVLLVELAVQ